MAWSALNEEACPVPEDVLGKFQGSETPDAVEVAKSLPEAQRAQLAVFCYRKRHLHALGLFIAATCELNALLKAAGPGGEVIFKQSRDPEQTLEQERKSQSHSGPKPITLAAGVQDQSLVPVADVDDEDDEDDDSGEQDLKAQA